MFPQRLAAPKTTLERTPARSLTPRKKESKHSVYVQYRPVTNRRRHQPCLRHHKKKTNKPRPTRPSTSCKKSPRFWSVSPLYTPPPSSLTSLTKITTTELPPRPSRTVHMHLPHREGCQSRSSRGINPSPPLFLFLFPSSSSWSLYLTRPEKKANFFQPLSFRLPSRNCAKARKRPRLSSRRADRRDDDGWLVGERGEGRGGKGLVDPLME